MLKHYYCTVTTHENQLRFIVGDIPFGPVSPAKSAKETRTQKRMILYTLNPTILPLWIVVLNLVNVGTVVCPTTARLGERVSQASSPLLEGVVLVGSTRYAAAVQHVGESDICRMLVQDWNYNIVSPPPRATRFSVSTLSKSSWCRRLRAQNGS